MRQVLVFPVDVPHGVSNTSCTRGKIQIAEATATGNELQNCYKHAEWMVCGILSKLLQVRSEPSAVDTGRTYHSAKSEGGHTE